MCVQLSPLCTPSLLRLQVALARVPFDLPLVYFIARAVSVRLISVGSSCLRCARPLLLRLQVALARVPFDLPLVYCTARAVSVRLIAFCFARNG